MIEVKNLTKKYGSKKAVDNISFTVNDGEILGFLGPNGAGKSTTMNIITGYLSPSEGTVNIAGFDILDEPERAKRFIGYLPEHPPLYQDMTVEEYLNFIYDLKNVSLPRKPHINEICRLVKIENVYKRVIKHLSKGYQQRVGIAQTLIGNPDVLILDEPTVGLDPKQIIDIRALIKNLGKTHTVILSSHILSEIQAVCERVIVINNGQLIADDTPDNLSKSLSNDSNVSVRVKGPEESVIKTISSIPGVRQVISTGKRESDAYEFNVEVDDGVDIRVELFNRMADRRWPILKIGMAELSLEDIFLKLISAADRKSNVESKIKKSVKRAAEKAGEQDNDSLLNQKSSKPYSKNVLDAVDTQIARNKLAKDSKEGDE